MLRKLRPRSAYDVMAAIAFFIVIAGGSAYAANTIGGGDVIDESLTGADIKGTNGAGATQGVNGSITGADISGQKSLSNGQPFVDGSLNTYDIQDRGLRGGDLAADSLTTSELGPNSVSTSEIKDGSVTPSKLGADTPLGMLTGRISGLPGSNPGDVVSPVYAPTTGVAKASPDATLSETLSAPSTVKARDLAVSYRGVFVGGIRFTLKLQVNGTDTALQCTVQPQVSDACTDTTHTVTIPPHSSLQIAVAENPGADGATKGGDLLFGWRTTSP